MVNSITERMDVVFPETDLAAGVLKCCTEHKYLNTVALFIAQCGSSHYCLICVAWWECVDTLLTYSLISVCVDTLLTCSLISVCVDTLLTYSLIVLCVDTLLTCSLIVISVDTLLTYYLIVICVDTLLTYSLIAICRCKLSLPTDCGGDLCQIPATV